MDPHGERQKRGVPPVTHTSGIKKWDDATKTWVNYTEADRYALAKAGIVPRVVYLTDGRTVRDGSPHIHIPSQWTDAEWAILEQKGKAQWDAWEAEWDVLEQKRKAQWDALEQEGMVH